MTNELKHENLRRLSDAYNAGYITADEYLKRSQAIYKLFYDTKYGKLDLSDIPG